MSDMEDIIPSVRIAGSVYRSFENDWYGGKHPWERFGQAFVNKFLREGSVRIPRLFYATDVAEARQIIEATFIDWTQ